MDNQHKLIKGYRDLSKQEIDLMNEIKSKAEEVGILVKKVHEVIDTASNDEDGREEDCKLYYDSECWDWWRIAEKELQSGFMKLVRSVAQPTTF